MYEVSVTGQFESDIGSGQKRFYDFSYVIKIPRFKPEGIETHILRRYLPYYIRKDKKNAQRLFSRVRNFVITEIKKLDEECPLHKRDINTLTELEIQDLACLYDLYEVPVTGAVSIVELRQKAILAYMKKVLKIPMKTPEEKAQLEFFKKQADGTYKLDLGDEKLIVEVDNSLFVEKKEEVKKKGLADFMKSTVVSVANTMLNLVGEQGSKGQDGSDENANANDGMPSASQLLNGNQ